MKDEAQSEKCEDIRFESDYKFKYRNLDPEGKAKCALTASFLF